MSLIMSLIGQIQAADKATQAAAVQNAQQVAATSAAKAQEQAMATIDVLNTMSAASSQAAQDRVMQSSQVSISMPQQSTAVILVPMQGPTVTSLQSLMTMSAQSVSSVASTTPVEQTYQPVVNNPSIFSMAAAYSTSKNQMPTYNEQQLSSVLSIQQSVAETAPVQFAKIESRSLDTETPAIPVMNSMTRGTSVTEIAEVRASIETVQNEQQSETVKKNVQPNELAGGVDIAAMATQPKGFDVYATTILKDGAFYAPKDIYGNQKTVDNARALRSLSSDRLHQEMIDLQYRR
jgi:tryptophan 2,3-dioxygenase